MYQRINLHQHVNILAFEDFLIEIAREMNNKDENTDLLTILKNINDDSSKFTVSSMILKKFYGRHAGNRLFLGKYAIKSPEKLYLVISIRGEKVVVIGGYITYRSAKRKVAEMLNVDVSTITRRNVSEIDNRIIVIKNFKDSMIR
jgi:Trp operon repressor